jgi:lauroyl/myristoyl acyltransferase
VPSSESTPWIDASDLVRGAVLVLLLGPMAWTVPARRWRGACRVAGRLLGRLREFQHQGWSHVVAPAVGARALPVAAPSVRAGTLGHAIEAMLQLLRDYRPGGWQPEITLEGKDRIDQALARGRGIILWVHRFHPFVHFLAIRRAGYEVCRASGAAHGHFYRSRFGQRWLNPIQTRIEGRYCERIVIRDGSLSHLRELQQRLRRNGIVSMYFDALAATRNIEAPFLEGRLDVAPRPATLALETGATLLPVFAVSDTPDRYRVIVEAPVELEGIADRRKAVEAIVSAHVKQLERYAVGYPDQWSEWWRVRL